MLKATYCKNCGCLYPDGEPPIYLPDYRMVERNYEVTEEICNDCLTETF